MLKTLGYTILVIAFLFIIMPWIVNVIELEFFSKWYNEYCVWVRKLFH